MDHFAWSFLKLGCWMRRQLSFLQHCRDADSLSPGPQQRQKAAVALGHSFLKIKNVTWAELRGLTPPLCLCLVCPLTDERWAIPQGVGESLGRRSILQGLKWRLCCFLVAESYPTLCDPMDCSLLASSVHGIFQARILEWVAISSSRGSSRPRDWTRVSCTCKQILYHWAIWEAQV